MKYIQVEIDAKCFQLGESVGILGYDMIRGNAAYQWEFDAQWLRKHGNIHLSGDLQNVGGPQFGSTRLFGFLQDAMPDTTRMGALRLREDEELLGVEYAETPVPPLSLSIIDKEYPLLSAVHMRHLCFRR